MNARPKYAKKRRSPRAICVQTIEISFLKWKKGVSIQFLKSKCFVSLVLKRLAKPAILL